MQEFIDYVEKQDYPRAISWCNDNMNKFSTLSAKYELMDIALMFDALCYDYLDSVWEYDELNRLMKETLNFLKNIMCKGDKKNENLR